MSANNQIRLDGLDELRRALMALPDELVQEASEIVVRHADDAKRDVQSGYPEKSGNLKRGVTTQRRYGSRSAVAVTVKSGARHAHLFERGTRERRTRHGANRGRMPEAPEAARMIPKVIRIRKRMTEELIELVRRAGFEVNV